MKSIVIHALSFSLVMCLCGFAAADEIEAKLAAAVEHYKAKAMAAREPVLSQLQRSRAAAQKEGDLQRLKQLSAELENFRSAGVQPSSVNPRVYDKYKRQVDRLNKNLESEYLSAIKRYTRLNRIAEAEAVQKEYEKFQEDVLSKMIDYLPVGSWVARYSPGKTVAMIEITKDRQAIFKDNSGRSRTGTIAAEGDKLVITYSDFVEVWSLDEKSEQITVGHYHPASRYPDSKPNYRAKLSSADGKRRR